MNLERIKKINNLIKEELGKIIFREIDFPQNILVTLTRVETTKDLGESKVFISCYPSEKSKEILEILEKEIFFLQKRLNKKLVIRKIPRIRFLQEKKTIEAGKIEEILANLKNKKN